MIRKTRNDEQGYKKLLAWQVADELAWKAYQLSDGFPKEELFVLTSQLRRASLSVPLNTIEGYGRNSKNEFRRFLNIALGSLAEVGYLLRFSYKRKYISGREYKEVLELKERSGQLLWKLMKSQN